MQIILKIMDSEGDYIVAKSIVQSGQSDEEWDSLRQGKGIWPVEKETWRQYRKHSLDKLVEMMDVYKLTKGYLLISCVILSG